jgi:hypothetical protein
MDIITTDIIVATITMAVSITISTIDGRHNRKLATKYYQKRSSAWQKVQKLPNMQGWYMRMLRWEFRNNSDQGRISLGSVPSEIGKSMKREIHQTIIREATNSSCNPPCISMVKNQILRKKYRFADSLLTFKLVYISI